MSPRRVKVGPRWPVLRAFWAAPSARLGLLLLALLLIVSIVAPPLLGDDARSLHVNNPSQGPGSGHLLGTDELGRDILARVLVATPLSIGLALAACGLGAAIGIPLGAGAALLGGRARDFALRAIDALLAFPAILIAIFVGVIATRGAFGAVLGVAIATSFAFARVSSVLSLAVGGREYLAAARVIGVRGPRLMLRYVLPNIADTLAVTTAVALSSSIAQISALSFLGLGVQAPQFDWGQLLTDGVGAFYTSPAAALGPAVAVTLTALAFGLTGEGLARAMNPVLWTHAGSGRRGKRGGWTGDVAQNGAGIVAQPGHTGAEPVLLVDDLRLSFGGSWGNQRVVDGVSFALGRGEVLGIVGESGSGKTMTALAVADLLPRSATVGGDVWLKGQRLRDLRRRQLDRLLGTELAVVFQDPMTSLNPAMRLRAQMTEARRVHGGADKRQAIEAAVAGLREVNLPAPAETLAKYPHELSGGMRQRVMIGMGLMNKPAVLVADEPTTALDVTIQAQIMELLWRANALGSSIILISHNLALVSQNCHRVLVMYAGRIVEELAASELVGGALHPYTKALVEAIPSLDARRDAPLPAIAGQAPDMSDIPSGCAFHPRCPVAVDRCRGETPPLVTRPERRRVACWVVNDGGEG